MKLSRHGLDVINDDVDKVETAERFNNVFGGFNV